MIACTTVSYGRVKGKAKQWPYFQACRYRVVRRLKDGMPQWRLVGTCGKAYRSYNKALAEARAQGVCLYARQNFPLTGGQLRLLLEADPSLRERMTPEDCVAAVIAAIRSVR